jgi:hypothetical protein
MVLRSSCNIPLDRELETFADGALPVAAAKLSLEGSCEVSLKGPVRFEVIQPP